MLEPCSQRVRVRQAAMLVSLLMIVILGGMPPPAMAQPATGSVVGRVFDLRNNQPLANAVITLGFGTINRAVLTDSAGRYRFDAAPPTPRTDVVAFLPGYAYLLHDEPIVAGRTTTSDFGLLPEANPNLVPTISNPAMSTQSVSLGAEVTFSMTLRPGSDIDISPEVLVASPTLGIMVPLLPVGNNVYRGSWRVPDTAAPGNHEFLFLGVDWVCREPSSFPRQSLTIEDKRFFPETSKTVPGVFLRYWASRGGLALYGFPISEAVEELSPTDGKRYLVQYFERNRFEHHPENAGTQFEVLLGLLGRQVTAGRENETPFQRVAPVADSNDRLYFEATGHTLGSQVRFKGYWESNGGLAQFGFPISEEFVERNATDGREYTVQYFERARFEHHPEFAGTKDEVLLGHLGRQVFGAR